MDLVTIIFKDDIELNLLKIQFFSYKFIKFEINNIYVIWNDDDNIDLQEYISWLPDYLREKVKLIHRNNLIGKKQSSWYNQQIIKILISRIVESDYYLVLDTKNHFIRDIYIHDYFYYNRPKLFIGDAGSMIKFCRNSLNYFDVKSNAKLLTTTPFLMNKNITIELYEFIEKKENKSFYDFFILNRALYTEFYLYQAFLIYSNSKYYLCNKNYCSVMNHPLTDWNTLNKYEETLKNTNIKCFGLHRNSIKYFNKDDKIKLIKMYELYYPDFVTEFIKKCIINLIKYE